MPQSNSTARRRVVVLTGASSGIGHATALAFAPDADLVLAARGREGLESVAQACRSLGAGVAVVPTDVTDTAAVQALAAAAIARFGRIDVWINNVGVVGTFDQVPMALHRRVVEANLVGHMNGAHAAIGHFRERGCGTLVNMISVGGLAAAPYAAAYCAAKFGVRGFSESLRAELSSLPDIHVCEVYPTFVDTPGLAHGGNHTGRRLKPPPPVLDPREVAAVLVSLAERPRASVTVGSVATPARLAHAVAPDLVGRVSRWIMDAAFARAEEVPITDGNLLVPSVGHSIDGGHRKPKARQAGALGLAAAAGVLGWWVLRGRARSA